MGKTDKTQQSQPADSQSVEQPSQPPAPPPVEQQVIPPAPPPAPPVQQPKPKKPKTVVIIADGFWGTQLLEAGDRTSDPEYLALVDDPRGAVRVVEWESLDE